MTSLCRVLLGLLLLHAVDARAETPLPVLLREDADLDALPLARCEDCGADLRVVAEEGDQVRVVTSGRSVRVLATFPRTSFVPQLTEDCPLVDAPGQVSRGSTTPGFKVVVGTPLEAGLLRFDRTPDGKAYKVEGERHTGYIDAGCVGISWHPRSQAWPNFVSESLVHAAWSDAKLGRGMVGVPVEVVAPTADGRTLVRYDEGSFAMVFAVPGASVSTSGLGLVGRQPRAERAKPFERPAYALPLRRGTRLYDKPGGAVIGIVLMDDWLEPSRVSPVAKMPGWATTDDTAIPLDLIVAFRKRR